MAVNAEDYAAIADHLGRYCFAVDADDSEAWVRLWTEDGQFLGGFPEPIVGREALKVVPVTSKQMVSRHCITNLHCDYGADRDHVVAQFYNTVTRWADGAAFACNADSRAELVRNGDGWLIARNEINLLLG